MKLDPIDIINILNKFNIYHEDKPNFKNWLKISCPYHKDENPSAGINLNSGTMNCFSCQLKISIIDFIKDRMNLDYKGVVKFIEEELPYLKHNKPDFKIEKKKEPEIKSYESEEDYPFVYIDMEPEKYNYTKVRGFTKEFCDKYNIKVALSGLYEDYAIIPIKDKIRNINTFEARKIKQYEYLCKFFSGFLKMEVGEVSLEFLQKAFKKEIKEKDIKYKKGRVYIKEEKVDDDILKYLMKPKTLYPSNSRISSTLFNIDNLNINKDLYICEGLATIPKLSMVYPNCTCTFGAKITESQIEILRTFKERIIIIPDMDNAGDDMVEFLKSYLDNLYVLPMPVEDTSPKYIECLKETELKEPTIYLQIDRDYYSKEIITNK